MTAQRVLIIDDVRVFVKVDPAEFVLTYARTSPESVEALQDGPWDMVFFDHDLGGEYETAMPAARYVVEHAHDFKDTMFVVHTSNAPAGDTLVSMFKSAKLTVHRVQASMWFSGVIDE
jgi:hypothetical protein